MIYLDHHACSPIDAEVALEMERARSVAWANPSSAHTAGRASRAILERARDELARAIGAKPADIVFTSGGTEACNLGVGRARSIATSAIEHPAVAEPIAALERSGARVVRLAVPDGEAPGADELDRLIEGAELAAIQWINHETGTIFPIAAYAERCRARGVPLFVDATQALGKIAIDAGALGASAIAFASSKVGGPLGAGALWIARDASIEPRMLGGAQERGRRGGTPDPIAIAGFGAACARIEARLATQDAIAARRDRVEAALAALGAVPNGLGGPRAATVTNVSVPRWRGPALVAALDLEGICASSGAACSSGVDEPSPVIRAMWPDEPWRAESALRLSLGPSTTDEEIDRAIGILSRVIARKV